MNIDPRSSWHDAAFVGRFAARELLATDNWPDHTDTVRRDMLRLIAGQITRGRIPGVVAEVGVRHGMSARVLLDALPTRDFILVENGCGFSAEDRRAELEATGQVVGSPYEPEAGALEDFRRSVASRPNVQFLAEDASALEELHGDLGPFALVHLDVDLYRPTRAALAYFGRRMASGGYILVHDYNAWPGARKATEEVLKRGLAKGCVPMPDKSGTMVLVF